MLSIRLTKPWRPLDDAHVRDLTGHLGVYEIAGDDGRTLFIGRAGGRTIFGLRGELERELRERGPGYRFRYEVNQQYWSRHKELLMAHIADHGELPPGNAGDRGRLGHLSAR